MEPASDGRPTKPPSESTIMLGATHRRDAQRGVRRRAHRVVDLGNDRWHREGLGGQLRREDVPVVALGQGEEAVGAVDAKPAQHVLVGAVTPDGVAAEALGQLVERVRAQVDDGDLVARHGEPTGQPGPDTSTAHDDGAHLYLGPSWVRCGTPASSTASRTTMTRQGAFWKT